MNNRRVIDSRLACFYSMNRKLVGLSSCMDILKKKKKKEKKKKKNVSEEDVDGKYEFLVTY